MIILFWTSIAINILQLIILQLKEREITKWYNKCKDLVEYHPDFNKGLTAGKPIMTDLEYQIAMQAKIDELKKLADFYLGLIQEHLKRSVGHENCHQNDTDLWYNAGLITYKEYYDRCWPTPEEFKAKCHEYLCEHHPLYVNNQIKWPNNPAKEAEGIKKDFTSDSRQTP